MNGERYRERLQRALDFIEAHLETGVKLEEMAAAAGYAPGHFIWIFRTVTGLTPGEYVRRRRTTEAARAILAGEDIVDAVYRYGFSAQDAFTRSFRNTIGLTPGRLRRTGAGLFTPALSLTGIKGGNKMLNYNLDCGDLKSMLRLEKMLDEETKELIGRIAAEKVNERSLDPHIVSELVQARLVRIEDGKAVIDTAVFLADDLEKIYTAAEGWGRELAERISTLEKRLPEMAPGLKRFIVGMNGIDRGTFDILIAEGYAFNHRSTGGRYAGAKVDFYEVCDAYDRFGPYLSGGYGWAGERYVISSIGEDRGIYGYLNAEANGDDENAFTFRTNTNKFLADSLGDLLSGRLSNRYLSAAAESAGLVKRGKTVVPVVTVDEAPAYAGAVGSVRGEIKVFLHDNISAMNAFLKTTLPGRRCVKLDKLTVDLMRYVRMLTHKNLYEGGFYRDRLPEGGSISICRELAANIEGK